MIDQAFSGPEKELWLQWRSEKRGKLNEWQADKMFVHALNHEMLL